MAEVLKRENDIVTLKVTLGRGDRVSCVLQFLDGGGLQDIPLWSGPIGELGVADVRTRAGASLDLFAYALPAALKDALASNFSQLMQMAPWRGFTWSSPMVCCVSFRGNACCRTSCRRRF